MTDKVEPFATVLSRNVYANQVQLGEPLEVLLDYLVVVIVVRFFSGLLELLSRSASDFPDFFVHVREIRELTHVRQSSFE